MLCDVVYLNPFANSKQLYTIYEKKRGKKIVRLNTVILTKLKVQSINDVALTDRESNKLRGDAIRLGDVYVCYVTHNEIMDTIYLR